MTWASRSAVAALGLAFALGPGDATAQQGVRSGFWAEGAMGTGTVRNSCGRCEDVASSYGGTDHLRVGVSLTPGVLVGLELFALDSPDLVLGPGAEPVDGAHQTLMPIVLWYVGRSGFFLKGGAGLARGDFTVATPSGPPSTTERTGSALTFGVGFDVAVLPWVALTAHLGTNVMAIGDVTVNGTVVDDIIATVYEAGVGIALR